MTDLDAIARLEDVRSAVLGDLAGGYRDAVREADGESVAAIMGFVASALADAGERLGLGALRRVAIHGEARGSLVVVRGDAVLTACVEPGRAVARLEKLLDEGDDGKV